MKTPWNGTLQERLARRAIRKPPAAIYLALANLWRLLIAPKYDVRYEYRVDPRKFRKGPLIVVSNHASRLDYIYAGLAFLPMRLNFVAGYNEFFRSHLALVFRLLQVIPKRNFTPDIYAARQIARILSAGGKVIVFPEGMSSIGGSNQPSALGSGNLLKHFGVPVLLVKIKGGYLTSTKYCLDERPGRVEVVVDLLFSPEELAGMSEAEAQERLDGALRHDDYEWNRTARVRFAGLGKMAHNLHHLLYWCPRCEGEFTMRGEGDTISCTSCGNGARLDEFYDLSPLAPDCVLPATPRAWYDLERERVRREVLAPGFELRERVRLGTLPRFRYLGHQATSEIVGEGELVLDREGLRYSGTREGKPFAFALPSAKVPTYGMCTDVTRFYTFHKGEFLEFYPEGETTIKWLLATEEVHRANGGPWKDFPDATARRQSSKTCD
jgi:1-acyl-sn-glycerol-3-phosphate acyltransferase